MDAETKGLSLHHMPGEVLLLIGSHLKLVADIAHLSRVNRHFHCWFDPVLYDPQQRRIQLDRLALPSAVQAACTPGVSKAIQAGASVNDNFDELPRLKGCYDLDSRVLCHAVYHGHGDIVKVLLDAGATQPEARWWRVPRWPNKWLHFHENDFVFESILEVAVQNSKLEIAESLLQHDRFTTTQQVFPGLVVAARQGHDEIFRKLLERLKDNYDNLSDEDKDGPVKEVQGNMKLWFVGSVIRDICDTPGKESVAVKSIMKQVLEYIKTRRWSISGPKSLHQVCLGYYDDPELVKMLVEAGCDPMEIGDDFDHLPINSALRDGKANISRYLLDKGYYRKNTMEIERLFNDLCSGRGDDAVDIAKRLWRRLSPSKDIFSPWQCDVEEVIRSNCTSGRGQLFQFLFDNDPEVKEAVTKSSNRHRFLNHACVANTTGHLAIAALLLKNGADPNSPSERGEIPLQTACESAGHDMIKLLLTYGAEPVRKPLGGSYLTAFNASWKREDFEAIRIMLEHLKIPIPPLGLGVNDGAAKRCDAVEELKKFDIHLSLDQYFLNAVAKGDIETMDYLFKHGHYQLKHDTSNFRLQMDHPLVLAVASGQVAAARKCLEMGYDPEAVSAWLCQGVTREVFRPSHVTQGQGTFPLDNRGLITRAAYDGNLEMVKLLLDGQRVNVLDASRGLELAVGTTRDIRMVRTLYAYLYLGRVEPKPKILPFLFEIAERDPKGRMRNALERMVN
ncbi:ankyrin repeats (3 copies) domain-containing protein [Pochonia chlamydosporia 170]|uniref:Ankyrin repeats (3 copies) domain-containing protein n=1 Tax=Pochonia chlamydosporia 170 TaxID=1380566 RepID=A0A179FRC0_METCM|nr:ankyrin repeats (3 copies) domain-containing protein [Pochonia chlamydosporia 170]OAQ67750.1 ankyrin repeats (3 copies) domain-containing protein [Pochonia chlamydosporia 170]